METQFFDKIKSLAEQYNVKLEPFGVKCTVNRRYFTSNAVSYGYHSDIIDMIAERFYSEKENAEFHHVPNRYKTVVLSVKPLKKGMVQNNDCKHYSFIAESTERPHKGKEPKCVIRNEEKLLKSIEKRLKKLLKRAEKEADVCWCKNNFADKMRYAFSAKYN